MSAELLFMAFACSCFCNCTVLSYSEPRDTSTLTSWPMGGGGGGWFGGGKFKRCIDECNEYISSCDRCPLKPLACAKIDAFDWLNPVTKSGVLWKRFRSVSMQGVVHGLPIFNVPILFFLRFISATLAYTIGPFCGDDGGVSILDWNRELHNIVEYRFEPISPKETQARYEMHSMVNGKWHLPVCRWNSSTNSAAVIRLDVGLDLILAVRNCTGVPGPPWVGVEADDNDCWCTDSTELDFMVAGNSSSSVEENEFLANWHWWRGELSLPPSSPATIDLARARPTLRAVLGSRRGGIGAGNLPPSVILRGNVAHCLAFIADENCCCCCCKARTLIMAYRGRLNNFLTICCCWKLLGKTCETTVIVTSEPDDRIKSTTCSCDAHRTSSPLIWGEKCELFIGNKGDNVEGIRIIFTASRKSPGERPAMSATPPGSTSSRYWRPGHRSVGLSCISGDAALAPRNTKPNPLLARWRTTDRASIIPLKRNAPFRMICTQLTQLQITFSFGVAPLHCYMLARVRWIHLAWIVRPGLRRWWCFVDKWPVVDLVVAVAVQIEIQH